MQRKYEPYVKCPDLRILPVCSVTWVWSSPSANFCLDYQTSPSLLETSLTQTGSGTETSPKREHFSNSKKQCLHHWCSVITICERRLWPNMMSLNTVLLLCYVKVGSLNPYGRKLYKIQIERELSAIAFACEKFDAFIYGRDSCRQNCVLHQSVFRECSRGCRSMIWILLIHRAQLICLKLMPLFLFESWRKLTIELPCLWVTPVSNRLPMRRLTILFWNNFVVSFKLAGRE